MRFLRALFWLAAFLGCTLVFLVLVEHGFDSPSAFADYTIQELDELASFARSLARQLRPAD